jgi:hypothetical protein
MPVETAFTGLHIRGRAYCPGATIALITGGMPNQKCAGCRAWRIIWALRGEARQKDCRSSSGEPEFMEGAFHCQLGWRGSVVSGRCERAHRVCRCRDRLLSADCSDALKYHLQKTYAEVSGDPNVDSEKVEAYKLLPQATADLLRGMEKRQKMVDVAIVVAVIINALILCVISTRLLDTMVGIVGNLVASAIVGGIVVVSRWRN